ncbi:hypothetical protein BSKO_12585 [Bryopsis sp. KO-2023]|nr:hypothetical protein BSKO_12585 [Bryopsis sp. KO-2023]
MAMVAIVAVGVAEASTELKHASRSLRLLPIRPNGFSVGWGLGLGAEVDDIEAEVDFGPFGFTLDPVPSEDKKEKKKSPPPAPAPAPACEKYCDPYTGIVCCATADGLCEPNGEVVEGCGLEPEAHYTYGYGRK